MLPDVSEIKNRRRQLGLTQAQLAQKAGVSQSLIAKIESGGIMPAYSKAKAIFDFFDSIKEKTVLRAVDLLKPLVKRIDAGAKIKDAIKLMEKNGISQLPVMEGEKVVGVVSENLIVEKLQAQKSLSEFREMAVREIMGEALPTISGTTPFGVISALLDHNPSVLVLKGGKIAGIISRSDLLKSIVAKTSTQG